MAELDPVQIPFGLPDRMPDQPAGHRARQLCQLPRGNLDRAAATVSICLASWAISAAHQRSSS